MAGKFTASIKGWSDRAKQSAELIFKQSAQDVFEIAQTPVAKGGNMPVDTGYLRNSLAMTLNGSSVSGGADAYVLAVASAELSDAIFGGWTADYARHVEYGTQGRSGRFFMRGAAQRWAAIVARNAAKVK